MLILGLVALVSDEVLELMFEEFSDKYKVSSNYWTYHYQMTNILDYIFGIFLMFKFSLFIN